MAPITLFPFMQIRLALGRAYGGEPAEIEVASLLAKFPRGLGFKITLDTFLERIREVRAEHLQRSEFTATEFKSMNEYWDSRHKHARCGLG
jgi:hypothetical protein